ncbi:MAG: 2-dehydropantoate 2-reductase [Flavobacteriales bacterium]|nr:2-dehydropantoate 2-reductase [Flavobacteriales bacterium]MCB9448588.1 2-dehydropantoate 2-reductase [Flavobacteriales bacterium]
MPERSYRLAIFGTGSLASLFAVRLKPHVQLTVFGTWEAQMDAMRNGLTLQETNGEEHTAAIHSASWNTFKGAPFDIILILTKAHQTPSLAAHAKRWLDQNSPIARVVTLQNGAGNIEILAEAVGREYVVGGFTTQAAMMVEPGFVQNTGDGKIVLEKDEHTPRASEEIAGLLKAAGFPTEVTGNFSTLFWRKLIVNATVNPLGAILGVPNGFFVSDKAPSDVMRHLTAEALSVGRAMHVVLPDPASMEQEIHDICSASAGNHNSMLRDILRGAATENEAISGYIVRQAERLGISVPYTHHAYQLVRQAENGQLQPGPGHQLHPTT